MVARKKEPRLVPSTPRNCWFVFSQLEMTRHWKVNHDIYLSRYVTGHSDMQLKWLEDSVPLSLEPVMFGCCMSMLWLAVKRIRRRIFYFDSYRPQTHAHAQSSLVLKLSHVEAMSQRVLIYGTTEHTPMQTMLSICTNALYTNSHVPSNNDRFCPPAGATRSDVRPARPY